jgi:hypothetical protein
MSSVTNLVFFTAILGDLASRSSFLPLASLVSKRYQVASSSPSPPENFSLSPSIPIAHNTTAKSGHVRPAGAKDKMEAVMNYRRYSLRAWALPQLLDGLDAVRQSLLDLECYGSGRLESDICDSKALTLGVGGGCNALRCCVHCLST